MTAIPPMMNRIPKTMRRTLPNSICCCRGALDVIKSVCSFIEGGDGLTETSVDAFGILVNFGFMYVSQI